MEKIAIFSYYKSLNTAEKKNFRIKVCNVCDIEQCTFNRRMRTDKWSKLEREAISRILNI